MPEAAAQKKRMPKPGTKRVMVTLDEAEYNYLVQTAGDQMRDPNNLLSFALRGRIENLLGSAIDGE